MPNTITSYVTFVSNTKARASQVNSNFSNHRGDLIPINSDTQTASTNTHNLGTDEHRWLGIYTNSIDFRTSTNTATLVLQGQVATTAGGFEFLVEGVTFGGLDTNGFYSKAIGVTTTAAAGQIAWSSTMAGSTVGTGALATVSSLLVCTLTTRGRPVEITLLAVNDAVNGSYVGVSGAASVDGIAGVYFDFYRDNSVAIAAGSVYATSATTTAGVSSRVPPSSIRAIDVVAAGTHSWSLRASVITGGFGDEWRANNIQMMARELN